MTRDSQTTAPTERRDATHRSSVAAEGAPSALATPEARRLADAIATRSATVAVLGLGYVGLPLAVAVARAGFPVIGYDIDPAKAEALAAGRSYIGDVTDDALAAALAAGFGATATPDDLAAADILIACVPTPLDRHREPDLSFVRRTAETVAGVMRGGAMFVLESTTYPGTTEEVVAPILTARGRTVGRDLFLAYSPEREEPGNQRFPTVAIPKVVAADDPASAALARAFYAAVVREVVPVSSTRTAEAVKLTENVFRAVNIALVNELKGVYEAMGVDVWEVIEAARTKPFGYMPFYPGPGLGGHCIPIDPYYLAWRARGVDVPTRFIELAGEINRAMPARVMDRLARALDETTGRGLNGARVLVIGLAYKKNVADVRESPALKLLSLLRERGADATFHDPLFDEVPPTREFGALAGLRGVALTAARVAEADAVLVATDHDGVDYALLADARLVVDTRNAMASRGLRARNVVKA